MIIPLGIRYFDVLFNFFPVLIHELEHRIYEEHVCWNLHGGCLYSTMTSYVRPVTVVDEVRVVCCII